jgi:MFS family permease
MRFRVWLTRHLGAPVTAEPTARAEDLLLGRAEDLPVLIAFRMLQAAGAAMLMPTSLGLALSVFPAHQRGSAIGGASTASERSWCSARWDWCARG